MPDAPAGTQENGTAQPPQEERVPVSRLNEKNTRIAQLEAELGQLRPKAQGYDSVNQQFQEAQAKLHQANASNTYLRAAAPHGFQPAVIDHLAGTYAQQQNALPEAQRVPFDRWLGGALANPAGMDPVTSAVLEKHLASRSGAAGAHGVTSPPPPPAPGPSTSPAPIVGASPPAVPPIVPPTTNTAVVPNPTPAAAMSQAEIEALVRDPAKFKEWKKAHPEEWARINRKR